MIPEEAIDAAKGAMQCVTPPPGVAKADWLAEHGSWALLAGAIAAAAPFIRAQALTDAADELDDQSPFHNYEDTQAHWKIGAKWAARLRARAVSERGGE